MSTFLYYYNDEDPILPYIGFNEREIPEGCYPPRNTLLIKPRLDENYNPLPGEWPVVNAARDNWDYVKDHRQHRDERDRIIDGTGTPYWLPDDPYGSQARYMTTLGSLPKNALLLPPDKPLDLAKQDKIDEINTGYADTLSYLLLDGNNTTSVAAVFMLEEAKQYDREGVQLVIEKLTAHKQLLLQSVEDAKSPSVVASIVVKYQA